MSRSQQKSSKRESRRGNKNDSRKLELVTDIFADVRMSEPHGAYKPSNTPIKPRNEKQGIYINAIFNDPITIGIGPAGVGKTFVAAALAADQLRNKKVERIVVTRPVLQAGEDLGFLPGDISEKFAPYFRPVYEVLRDRLGIGYLTYCLKPEVEKVLIAPFAFLRGMSFKNSIVFLDEAQNTTVPQMKLFLTRVGEGATVIINGDLDQCDLPKGVQSGLADLLERIKNKGSDIPVVYFSDEDSVRGKVCSIALNLYK